MDGTPKGRLFPPSRGDLIECAALIDSANTIVAVVRGKIACPVVATDALVADGRRAFRTALCSAARPRGVDRPKFEDQTPCKSDCPCTSAETEQEPVPVASDAERPLPGSLRTEFALRQRRTVQASGCYTKGDNGVFFDDRWRSVAIMPPF